MTFAAKLKELRAAYGWTQHDMAQAIGVSQSAIAMFENSDRLPGMVTLRKFASKLGLSVTDLIDETEIGANEALVKTIANHCRQLSNEDLVMVIRLVSQLPKKA